ncbi:MAG: hypothetical protein QE271_01365 [Bacteriovoracaceae bacterium]|nr:hypothetical protein [Bacteriovoracaceae bacterium]
MFKLLYFFVTFLLLQNVSFAKRFSNQYLEFDLPPSWDCVLEGSEWVCQSGNDNRKKEAIVIFAAKKRGSRDTLDEYQSFLKKQKTFNLPGGKVQNSDAKYSKMVEINGQRWVDALHLASEIPGFYTRYLASVKEDLGVVVTFSVSQDMYNLYQPVFEKMIKSIRVFRQGTGNLPAAKIAGAGGRGGEEGLEGSVVVNEDDVINIKKPKKESGSSKKVSSSDDNFLLILGGVVVVLFFLAKRRKK